MEHIVADKKIGSDNQEFLIALLQNLDKLDELPEFVTKEHYSEVRDCYNQGGRTFEPWYIGAVGFLASYNGRFFDGGYAGIVKSKDGPMRNYYDEAKRNLQASATKLVDVKFLHGDYRYAPRIEGAVIYCDPPYKGTKQYNSSRDFNHDDFWEWVRQTSKTNKVIVSEQSAPEDMRCIWEQSITRNIDYSKSLRVTEKLYTYN